MRLWVNFFLFKKLFAVVVGMWCAIRKKWKTEKSWFWLLWCLRKDNKNVHVLSNLSHLLLWSQSDIITAEVSSVWNETQKCPAQDHTTGGSQVLRQPAQNSIAMATSERKGASETMGLILSQHHPSVYNVQREQLNSFSDGEFSLSQRSWFLCNCNC